MSDKKLAPHRTTVRVTMFPDPIEVDKDEIPNLRSQGLLVEDDDADSGEPDASATGRSRRNTPPPAGGSGTSTSPPAGGESGNPE